MEKQKTQWLFSSRNKEELSERYDQWAKDYDAELERDFEWRGPQCTAGFFIKHVLKEARILDAGAGTGLMGEALVKLGYDNLVAMDLSQAMLEEACKKNIYREFHQMRLLSPHVPYLAEKVLQIRLQSPKSSDKGSSSIAF